MPLPDMIHQQHLAALTLMSSTLHAAGMTTQLIEANDELPVSALVVDLGADELDRKRSMTISIMPFGDDTFAATQFIQFYVPMPYAVTRDQRGDLGQAMAVVNGAMAVGHFAWRGKEIFYRYMLSLSSSAFIDDAMLGELMPMLVFHQEHFSDYLEGVLDDEISLSILPDLVNSSDVE